MPFEAVGYKRGFIYILSNKSRSVLYIGVTSNLKTRIWQHKNGQGSSFTKKYNTTDLLYFEKHETIQLAIDREKQLKNWHQEWKLNLIKEFNPTMEDIFETL